MRTPDANLPAQVPEFVGESIGEPVAVSSFARMLLRLHRQPARLRLVSKKNDGERIDEDEAQGR